MIEYLLYCMEQLTRRSRQRRALHEQGNARWNGKDFSNSGKAHAQEIKSALTTTSYFFFSAST
jgi:hypothetical protein